MPAHLLTRPAGAAAPDQVLRLALRLIGRGGDAAIFARAAELGGQHPRQRQYLDAQSLAAEFGPPPEALDAVRAFCVQHGFTLDHTSMGGLFVTIVGKAGDLARAFDVELSMYHHEDRTFRGYAGTLALPPALDAHVAAVLGMDELASLPARQTTTEDNTCWVSTNSNGHNSPITVANQYYQYPTSYSGVGATIALIEDNLLVDQENYTQYFQSLNEDVKVELIHGANSAAKVAGAKLASHTDYNGEAMLDIKLAGSVAPGATLVVYGRSEDYGHGGGSWIDTLLEAFDNTAYPCNVASISLGVPEYCWDPQYAQSVNLLFAVATLTGVTICVSSGDYGARGNPKGLLAQNCAFPASSPYCLACGGTELIISDDLALDGEVVWNEMSQVGQKCATGGGRSVLFPVPDYQQGLALPDSFNAGLLAGRALPDVAANAAIASGYAMQPPGLPSDYYGTSAAAPMWAALIARLVEGCDKALGYLNPWLYAGQIDFSSSFCTPITEGNNGAPGDTVAFYAETGNVWNACCGLGSPVGVHIANGLGLMPARP
ncbi:hypothetical protein AKI39_16825 [Bordetella sp. H567]|nr:hypothetical protein AKI39_16825 [Bordetella sp. H567]